MASLNSVTIIGRLGQDPKLSYLASGKAVCNLSVATDESYKGQDGAKVEKVEWHKVQVWGKSAEYCANYLHKGSMICIEGKLATRSWEKDGQKHYVTEVIAQRVQGLDKRQDGQSNNDQTSLSSNGAGFQRSQGQSRGTPSNNDDLGPAFPADDQIPF